MSRRRRSPGSSLAEATTLEVEDRPLVLVPVGSLEQHGPHLPLDTDTVIAVAVAERVGALLDEPGGAVGGGAVGGGAVGSGPVGSGLVVAPPVAYGASGEHQHFAGTSSIGTDVLASVLVELARSMGTWARRVVFVNAHGGNVSALRTATGQLLREGHDVGWVACATEEVDAHAGFTETSLMLALRPGLVRLDRAEAGNTAPIAELLAALVAGGVVAVSPNGVLGDPAGATAEQGSVLLGQIARDLADLVDSGTADEGGRLR